MQMHYPAWWRSSLLQQPVGAGSPPPAASARARESGHPAVNQQQRSQSHTDLRWVLHPGEHVYERFFFPFSVLQKEQIKPMNTVCIWIPHWFEDLAGWQGLTSRAGSDSLLAQSDTLPVQNISSLTAALPCKNQDIGLGVYESLFSFFNLQN